MISIIIPIFNEESILIGSLEKLSLEIETSLKLNEDLEVEVVVCDSKSTDRSYQLALEFSKNQPKFKVIQCDDDVRSIGRTVTFGAQNASFDNLFILPIDCYINSKGILEFFKLTRSHYDYGGFGKIYVNQGALMRLYAKMQNLIRTKMLSNYVWTNGIIFNKRVFDQVEIPTDGFMEDVIFSDNLKLNYKDHYLGDYLLVDSRLYDQKGPLKRIFINALIMTLYRRGFKNKDFLKRIYRL